MPEHYAARERSLDYLLIWVLAGRGWGQSEGRRVEVRSGQVLLFRKGPAHAYASDLKDPWNILWVHFDGRAAAELAGQIRGFGDNLGLRIDLGAQERIHDRFLELVSLPAGAGRQADELAHCLLWGLLGLVLDHLRRRAAAGRGETLAGNDRLEAVYHLQGHIQQHLAEPISLTGLARAASLSPSQLGRVFHRLFRTSPIEYVIARRVARASVLLTETNLAVKQVSLSVGYRDPYYFSRIFKKSTGLAPSAYRRRHA
jgi:AraC-like DNA-binding protein